MSAPPVARNVFCGQVVTQSTIVQNDLADCLYDGLVIGADGITIDLDGHIVDGKGIGAGIRNDGFDNVTIRNGTITEYDFGVMLNQGTTGNIVEELTVHKTEEAGVALGNPPPVDPALPQPPPPTSNYDSNVDGNTIRFNDLLVNDIGVWLTNRAQDNVVRDNRFAANSKHGIWVERASGTRMDSNEIISTGGEGIALEGADSNVVSNSYLEDNSGGGILVGLTTSGVPGNVGLPSNNNVIESNNLIESGGDAIEVEGTSIHAHQRDPDDRQHRVRLERRRHLAQLCARRAHQGQRRQRATRAASASRTPPTAASRGTPPTSPTATASPPSRSR